MKKLVCFLCNLILVMGLAGCGGSATIGVETEESSVENSVEGQLEESNEQEVRLDAYGYEDYWVVKVMDTPSIGPITNVREDTVVGAVTTTLGTTPFDYDIIEIESAFHENEFLTEHYDLGIKTRENFNGASYVEGDFINCGISNSVYGKYKNTEVSEYYSITPDFSFTLGRRTEEYDNYNSISISFKDVKMTMELQEQIYTVLEDALGAELAEYMVYATDVEGNDSDKLEVTFEASGEADPETGWKDWYKIERSVDYNKYDEDEEKVGNIDFSLYVDSYHYDVGFDNFKYYDGDYEPLAVKAKYNISEITNNGISDLDIRNFSKFAPEYMNISTGGNYVGTYLTSFMYSEASDDLGGKEYWMSGYFKQGCHENYERNADCPCLDMRYTICEMNEDITYIDLAFGSESKDFELDNSDKVNYEKQVIDIMCQQIATVIPGIDLSEITYDNVKNAKNETVKIETPYIVLGKECSCVIVVKAAESWDVTIMYDAR